MGFFRRYSFDEGREAVKTFQDSTVPMWVYVNVQDGFIVLSAERVEHYSYPESGYSLICRKGEDPITFPDSRIPDRVIYIMSAAVTREPAKWVSLWKRLFASPGK